MGVQSIFPEETSAVQRRQRPEHVERALRWLGDAVPVRNVDLIYGLPGQTPETLCASIDRVIALGANELYLYPLYVRPATGLGKKGPSYTDLRLAAYRAGRDLLCSEGYVQVSMRNFRRASAALACCSRW